MVVPRAVSNPESHAVKDLKLKSKVAKQGGVHAALIAPASNEQHILLVDSGSDVRIKRGFHFELPCHCASLRVIR